MLKSRKDETLDENDASFRFSGESGLSIEERRARRKAKRQEETTDEVDQQDLEDYEDDEDAAKGSAVTEGKQERTRSRREAELARRREAQGRMESMPVIGTVLSYFRGVNTEVRKVTWPTREEARRLTTIVLAFTVAFSIFLGAVDLFYGEWFRLGIESTNTFLIIGGVLLVAGGGIGYVLNKQGIL